MSHQSITLLTDHQSFLTESIVIILLRKKCERRKEEWKKERRVEERKKKGKTRRVNSGLALEWLWIKTVKRVKRENIERRRENGVKQRDGV